MSKFYKVTLGNHKNGQQAYTCKRNFYTKRMALHFIERTLNEGQYRDAVLTTHEVDEFNLVSLIDSQEFQYENITQQIYRISHEVIYD